MQSAFEHLFKSAFRKCFDRELTGPMTEPESKLLAVEIESKTGLTIGFKSLKNYSVHLFSAGTDRFENPSNATLDTLARYVLNAPPTTENKRKKEEGHYPYWHLFQKGITAKKTNYWLISAIFLTISFLAFLVTLWLNLSESDQNSQAFTENFEKIGDADLSAKGWFLMNKSDEHWHLRNQEPGNLTLFTLPGDNWPENDSTDLVIPNLLTRELRGDCFALEVQFEEFVPREPWQQAGMLLMEDTTQNSRALRLSIAYNNYFGGFGGTPEIIVQGVVAEGFKNPEEVIHHQIFEVDSASLHLIRNNLSFSALKIEKSKNTYRFLLANGASKNVAFKEISQQTIAFEPRYVGLFAIKGNVSATSVVPVRIEGFSAELKSCE